MATDSTSRLTTLISSYRLRLGAELPNKADVSTNRGALTHRDDEDPSPTAQDDKGIGRPRVRNFPTEFLNSFVEEPQNSE
jgi:hypothetical protein